MKRIVSIKPVFIVIVAQFFITFFQASFFPYFSIYLQDKGIDPLLVSLLSVVRSVTEVLGILVGGIYADSVNVGVYTGYGFLLLAGGYCLVPLAHSLGVYFITFSLIGFLYGFAYSCESNFVILNREHLSLSRLYILINISMTLARLFAPFLGVFGVLHYAHYIIYLFSLFSFCYGGVLLATRSSHVRRIVQKSHGHIKSFLHYKFIFKNKDFVLLAFFLLLVTVCENSLYTSLPIYLKERFQDSGVYMYTLVFCINEWIIASLFIFLRKLIEKLSNIDWIIASSFLYSLVFLILGKYGNVPSAALLLVICFSFAEVTTKPIAYGLVVKLADKEHIGKYQAIANLRFFLSGGLSSFIGGLFIREGNAYYSAYLLISVITIPLAFIIRRNISHKLNK